MQHLGEVGGGPWADHGQSDPANWLHGPLAQHQRMRVTAADKHDIPHQWKRKLHRWSRSQRAHQPTKRSALGPPTECDHFPMSLCIRPLVQPVSFRRHSPHECSPTAIGELHRVSTPSPARKHTVRLGELWPVLRLSYIHTGPFLECRTFLWALSRASAASVVVSARFIRWAPGGEPLLTGGIPCPVNS